MKTYLSFFALAMLLPSYAAATTATMVYEPHTFTREIAQPETFSDNFQACDPKGTFKIIVDNGDETGKNRVSSAIISVNGVPVVTQNDFNQKTARIEKALTNIAEENSIEVTLNSKPWSHITVSVEGIMSCLEVKIKEPQDGAAINKGSTMVKGTVESQTADVGIRVNGVLAEIQGENWIAAGVPLTSGENEIKAVATDGTGNRDEKSVTVNCESDAQPLKVMLSPSSGIAPLETSLIIDTNIGGTVSLYKIDFDGDGTIDVETDSPDDISHKYEVPGLYLPVVTVVDSEGAEFKEITVVNVISLKMLDLMIQSKWSRVSAALKNEEIDNALGHFLGGVNSKYKKVFETLNDKLAETYSAIDSVNFINLKERWMEYEIIITEGEETYSYPLIFYRNAEGLWKIYQL